MVNHFVEKKKNVIDATSPLIVGKDGHDLIFLPGTDFSCGGEYIMGSGEIPSGKYIRTDKGLMGFDKFDSSFNQIYQDYGNGLMQYSNMGDLERLFEEPKKSILFSHVPMKFDNVIYGVDMAEFGEVLETFDINGQCIEKNSVFPISVARNILGEISNAPIEIKCENRGNDDLKRVNQEIGYGVHISGHFHESAHRAHDSKCNPVVEGEFVDELYWNASYLDGGKFGILYVRDDGKVSYQNLELD